MGDPNWDSITAIGAGLMVSAASVWFGSPESAKKELARCEELLGLLAGNLGFKIERDRPQVQITLKPGQSEFRHGIGPIEADFKRRHLRRIDISGDNICTGGHIRCEYCRCNLPDDWRKQDEAILRATEAKDGQ